MPELVIIADDLTGALDAAAPFRDVPGGVTVATRTDALAAALQSGAGVVSVSTRSREIAADEARARVGAVLAALPRGVRLFKKIDSRLKGHVAAELEPFGAAEFLVSPAICDLGRIVRDGRLQGFGVAEPIAIAPRLGRAADRARIPDAVVETDLRDAVRDCDDDTVLVGARGLAQAVAGSMGLRQSPVSMTLPSPLCFAVGSTDPITLAQVAALKSAHGGLAAIEAPSGRVDVRPDGALSPLTLLQVVPGAQAAPAEVARRFARGAAEWLMAARSMLLTGGATAEALLDSLRIGLLRVEGEILPGVPLCRSGDTVVMTKSGGFGDADTLVRIAGGSAG
ncbi:MAG: four-carbon acid sugar kinase family protein [Geminicoccaceae bacterium]